MRICFRLAAGLGEPSRVPTEHAVHGCFIPPLVPGMAEMEEVSPQPYADNLKCVTRAVIVCLLLLVLRVGIFIW